MTGTGGRERPEPTVSAQGAPPPAPDLVAERLRDALTAPYRAVPDGLVEATLKEVRRTRQDRPGLRLGILAAAAAVLVVAVVGILAVAVPRDTGPTGTAAPSVVVASSVVPWPATAAPQSADFPATVLGLDVVSVSDALAVRDAAAGPGTPVPLAVRGWYTSQGVFCPYPGPVDALESLCPSAFVWLTETREDLVTATGNSVSGRRPTGPALNPRFLGGVTSPEVPTGRALGRKLNANPIPVVLVGHWNDGRAAFCTAAAAATCAREFVVDGVAWALGDPVAPMLFVGTDRTTSRTAGEVIDAASQALGGWTVASLAVFPRDEMALTDPRLLDRDVPVPGDIVWIARLIRRGEEPMTLLVSDLDGSTARLPAWPVRGPVVDGLAGETAGLPVVDAPAARCDDWMVGGILAWSDGPTVRVVGAGDMRLAAFVDGRLLARRVDGEVALVQAGGHVVVTPGWHTYNVCNVLTGDGAVGVIREVDGKPLPTYQLSCGSLEREDCLSRAAEVEETVAKHHAGRTLASLRFSGPCGDYDANLDDNTGFGADILCVLTPSPSPSPSITSTACGYDPPGTCAALVDLVRRDDPVAFARAGSIVTVGTCPPDASCVAPLRPSLYVVLVPHAWNGAAAALEVWLAQGESRNTAIDLGAATAGRVSAVPEFVVAAVAAAQP